MANLLEKSSILITPTAYSDGKIHSAKPIQSLGGLDADLDFARGSSATRVNADGLIESSQGINTPRINYENGVGSLLLEGNSTNLITESEAFGKSYWTKSGASIEGDSSTAGVEKVVNGDFATDTDWTKGANTVISGGKLINSNSGAYSPTTQSLALSVGTYLITYTIDSISNGSVVLGVTGLDLPSKNTSGTYSQQITLSSASTLLNIYSATAGTVFTLDNVSVKEVQGFSAPSVDSPLGAFKLVENVGGIFRNISRNTAKVASALDYSASFRVKPNGRNWLVLTLSDGTAGNRAEQYFDITNGVKGTSESFGTFVFKNSTITSLSGGYFDISVTATSGTELVVKTALSLAEADNDTNYTGDGTSGVYIFASQMEQNSSATSYIKTEGTTISRTADSASKSGISSLIGQTEGTLFMEMSALANDLTNRTIGILGDSSNFIELAYRDVTNQIRVLIKSSNVVVVNLQYSLPDVTLYNKIAVKYKSNDWSLWVNGFEVLTDTSASMPSGLSQLSFNRFDGTEDFYGNVKSLQVYKTALTDEELTCLTKI